MMDLMSQQALDLGAARRREVALETMRAARASDGLRHVVGLAIIALGRRIAGEMPAAGRRMQPTGERL